ncbi:MAG TPA: YdcF family protein [Rhodocyclaceae bacterium]|nr:YdcF family protein [Rhodocyclaceae bacterium]HRQ46349.1 YdcF family protein [Rhodocyclaceae bacterium]
MAFDTAIALFWLKKIAALAALPPLGPLLLMALGLIVLRRHRRVGLTLGWTGLALAFLLSAPASVGLMARNLETTPPLVIAEAETAQAIVILGGGKREHAPEYGGETVNRLTLERLRYGARLARETGLPILVSGGTARTGMAEADLMQAALEIDFRMPVRWTESASRDTRENAQFSAVQLKAANVHRVVLVTHAIHMERARSEFEAQGLEVVSAPTAWFGGGDADPRIRDIVPNAWAAFAGWIAAHEWLGQLAYRISRS